ncbi:MbcA/ParS/Xre antitoxin family protein [Oceaniovalibus sp. ACAM 378]|uniref:MbcA/ParS/Xre antitoxin family protein n=1 Tax=Oceaniovalibus sp. ACAM 378 TaxID=2599923 RepID=UPI0011DB3666|nr:MbcA/ParS/Xre antitoxin family protein [Oceaniovalibus sp. ACAM 378]TYB83403.1 DUF2384 domain-containing protein [Oceaniovalibus sp. ACAM 378]
MSSDIQPAPPSQDLTADEAHAAARAIVNLFDRWKLSDEDACQLLGGMTQRTLTRWRQGEIGRINRDLGTRLSLLLGIHTGTRYMFGQDTSRAHQWIKAKNSAFGGRSGLEIMLSGQIIDLYGVRRYLDAECSGW